jgi:5'-3' exoribonuclease 1
VGVQVFSQASKRESLVLCCPAPQEGLKPDAVAGVILGERCYIEWPFLKEAEVTGVSDVMATVRSKGVSSHSDKERTDWAVGASIMKNEFLKKGIDIDECRLVLHMRPLEGLSVQPDGTIEKRFSTKELRFPLQVRRPSIALTSSVSVYVTLHPLILRL